MLVDELRASAGDARVLLDLLVRTLMVLAIYGVGNAGLSSWAKSAEAGGERVARNATAVGWFVLTLATLVLVAVYSLRLESAGPIYDWGDELVAWLESRTVGVLVIIAAALVALKLVRFVVHSIAPDLSVFSRATVRRETLRRVLSSALRVTIIVAAGVTILGNVGINVTALLAGVSIVGLAVSFGAQSLVKDVITGFFILLEDQYGVGDVIGINGPQGLSGGVEAVSLRTTVLRSLDGTAHIIPNGQIERVSVMSRDWAQVVADVQVSYRHSIDDAIVLIRTVAGDLRDDPEWAPRFLENPEVLGVESLGENGATVRVLMKVLPKEQWGIAREFRRRVKNAFDTAGIEIPSPRLSLHVTAQEAAVLGSLTSVASPAQTPPSQPEGSGH
jgi:small-conductance mechanosensitive channel